MSMHQAVKDGIKDALKAKDEVRLRTLRSLSAAMTNEVVAKKRKPDELLTDEEAMAVLKRAANQRKDSIEQFEKGGRPELAATEKEELTVIEALLPSMMSREEIARVVTAKIAETGMNDKTKAGQLTGIVMKDLKGKADGGDVKAVIDELLA